MSRLIIGMGIPGSGKSTYLKFMVGDKLEHEYVSRDEIRFSLVKEDEEYFSREDDVWAEFVRRINEGLAAGKTVWADATHISVKSRAKLLRALEKMPDEIAVLWLDTPLQVAYERNLQRDGSRAYVPESVIERMWYSLQEPRFNEVTGFEYDVIYIKRPDEQVEVKRNDRKAKDIIP